MKNKHKVFVFGGGTFNHVSCHLALAAPAFGGTAKKLHNMFTEQDMFESNLVLTKMADPNSTLITNDDVQRRVDEMVKDLSVKVVVMNAAICDFEMASPDEGRLSSVKDYPMILKGIQGKIISSIRKVRPDIILVGFKTTKDELPTSQLAKAAASMAASGLDFVLANDVGTRNNILLSHELCVYKGARDSLLGKLIEEVTNMYRLSVWLG